MLPYPPSPLHLRSRGTTKRTKAAPLGDLSAPSVLKGNLMACRCAIILLIAAARSLFWVLEQPQSSLFEMHPMVQRVFALAPTFRKSIRMGHFGGCSLKPTWLYSGTCQLLSNIFEYFMTPKGLAEPKHHPNGLENRRFIFVFRCYGLQGCFKFP